MARPRPVAPGTASPTQPAKTGAAMRSGSLEAMRDLARRKAAMTQQGAVKKSV